jgi:hypothetical protein
MELKAGTIADQSGSMAKAMEEAFMAEWPNVMKNQPLPEPNDQMRLLFIAVAQGIVRHLVANPDAFVVSVASAINHSHAASISIKSTENT